MAPSGRNRRRNADQAAMDEGGQYIRNTRRRVSNANNAHVYTNTFRSPPPPTMSQSRTQRAVDARGATHQFNIQFNDPQAPYAAVTPSPNGGTTANNRVSSSIRSNARQVTRSQGHYNNRSYHLGYYHTQPDPPNLSTTDTTRICYCDQAPCPQSCPHAQGAVGNCPDHVIVHCVAIGCHKSFHLECIKKYKRSDAFQASNPFLCCLHEHTKAWEDAMQQATSSADICKRYGIDTSPPLPTNRYLERKINQVKGSLEQCNIPENIVEEIGRSPSLPFPSIVKMDDGLAEKEAEAGRRFEVSMLMFQVDTCSCCGITQPHHIDPFYPKESPLPRYHLNTKYYDAWECNCFNVCHGQQFYGANRPNMMEAFKSLHDNMPPDLFICGIAGAPPNARLCHDCCFEYQKRENGDIYEGKLLSFLFAIVCVCEPKQNIPFICISRIFNI
jgi:hypothetical protein